jgi:heat shock protein HslJ
MVKNATTTGRLPATRTGAIAVVLIVAAACSSESGEAPVDRTETAPAEFAPEVVEAPSVVGAWRVVLIDMSDGEDLTPDPDAIPTLTFSDEATPTGSRMLTGFTGCNRLTASYDAGRSGSLAISGSPAMTRMACPEDITRVEQILMVALESARSYSVEDAVLTIVFGGGQIRLGAVSTGG